MKKHKKSKRRKNMPHKIPTARQNMIDGQLRPNGINNKALLASFTNTPRDLFLEGSSKDIAHADTPAPLTDSITNPRSMFTPLVQARLIQALDLQPHHNVLVIAADTGYTAAIMAPLVQHVTLVEDNKHLTDLTRHAMLELDIKNITQVTTNPAKGAVKYGPYDRILINAPVPEIPTDITAQLASGGQLTAVVKGQDGLMDITHATKRGKTLMLESLFETKTMPIPTAFKATESFVF